MRILWQRLGVVAVISLLLGVLVLFYINKDKTPVSPAVQVQDLLIIGDDQVRISYARTDAERERGLSGRQSLDSDEGLLFIFPKDGRYGFWMPDMRFAIDIIWIDSTMHIVDMAANVSPESYPKVFAPKTDARYVLEVSASSTQQKNWNIGDAVSIVE